MSASDWRSVVDRLRVWSRHIPSGPTALRAALAAVAAWLVVLTMGGVADDYPYYAPLGAVVVVSSSVSGSIRSTLQSVGAIAVGALMGIGTAAAPLPMPVGVALVVGIGTVLGAVRWFDNQGSWVPISALFVLVLGGDDPWHYGFGYFALVTLGAFVGAGLTAALPPLRLGEASRAQTVLRDALVAQLQDLAAAMQEDLPPNAEGWKSLQVDLESRSGHVRRLVPEALEGANTNWRTQRHAQQAEGLAAEGRILVSLALHVADLADFLAEHEDADRETVPLGPDLRPSLGVALRETARVLSTVDWPDVDVEALRGARRAVEAYADDVRQSRRRTDADLFDAGALVRRLQRQLARLEQYPAVEDDED